MYSHGCSEPNCDDGTKNLGQCEVVLGLLINIMMLFHCLELEAYSAGEEQFLSSQNLEIEVVSSHWEQREGAGRTAHRAGSAE